MGNKENICSCIDWKNADAGDIIEHLLWRNEFHRLELDYEALTQGATIRLCELGVCTVCGGRICIGTMFQAKEDRGETPVSYTHLDVYKRQLQAYNKEAV